MILKLNIQNIILQLMVQLFIIFLMYKVIGFVWEKLLQQQMEKLIQKLFFIYVQLENILIVKVKNIIILLNNEKKIYIGVQKQLRNINLIWNLECLKNMLEEKFFLIIVSILLLVLIVVVCYIFQIYVLKRMFNQKFKNFVN